MSKAPEQRSGFVSITGRPNVGKSTFLNAVLGQKVSIVAPKAQTTRNRVIGIKTLPHAQVIFVDTPGIHRPRHSLGAYMVKEAKAAIKDVDVVLLMVEPRRPTGDDAAVIRLLRNARKPVILLINKSDTVKKPDLLPVMDEYRGLYDFDEVIPISALKGDGLGIVMEKTVERLPPGPRFYPDDLVTDRLERFLVAEMVREKILWYTEEEVPHSTAVEVVRWEEKEGGGIYISANIYVEKEGQKRIIIGKSGQMLKKIGTAARKEMEGLLGARVFLELWVKVKKHWRTDRAALTELGFE
ncbi:MAG: GTPase Era [Thermodesulfovibrionales bacterium]